MRGRKEEAPQLDLGRRAAVAAVLRQRTLPPRVRERLELVKARALGQEVGSSAQWSGRTVRTVNRGLRP